MKRLLAIFALAAFCCAGSVTAATVLNAEAGSTGGSTHVPLVAFAKAVSDAEAAEIQVTDGNTLTKTLIGIATGKGDMGIVPIGAYNLLRNAAGPYSKLGQDKSAALKSKMRVVFSYSAGYYTMVTFADSGINSWDEFKGKKVLVGPPSGAASNVTIALIKAATGLEPEKDYEAVKMGWGAVNQAFTDRKVDVMMRPGPWPNANFAQLAAAGELRILSLPENVFQAKIAKRAGLSRANVPTAKMGEGAYSFAGANSDGTSNQMAYIMTLSVNENMDADLVYNITKAFFERYDQSMKAAAWMPGLEINKIVTGLDTVDVKLHSGALRYYDEAGYSIPASAR